MQTVYMCYNVDRISRLDQGFTIRSCWMLEIEWELGSVWFGPQAATPYICRIQRTPAPQRRIPNHLTHLERLAGLPVATRTAQRPKSSKYQRSVDRICDAVTRFLRKYYVGRERTEAGLFVILAPSTAATRARASGAFLFARRTVQQHFAV